MQSEKPVATNNGSMLRTDNGLTMDTIPQTKPKFQYECSFCLRELPSGGHRFDGIGACPRCFKLAHQFVDALRGHRANYYSNLGVKR